jgi:hypothetical protein
MLPLGKTPNTPNAARAVVRIRALACHSVNTQTIGKNAYLALFPSILRVIY